MHGGRAPQVQQAALRRLALADAVHAADPRPPGEILLDTLHVADVLLRQAIAGTGAAMTPEQLSVVCGHLERAQGFARAVLSAGVEERRTQLAERVGSAIRDTLKAVLDELALSPQQRTVARAVVPRHLELLRAAVQ